MQPWKATVIQQLLCQLQLTELQRLEAQSREAKSLLVHYAHILTFRSKL